jgi:hypothetical protein
MQSWNIPLLPIIYPVNSISTIHLTNPGAHFNTNEHENIGKYSELQ